MCSFSRNLSLHSVQPRSRLKTVVVVETQPGFVNNNNNDDNDNNNNNNSDNAYFVILCCRITLSERLSNYLVLVVLFIGFKTGEILVLF